jgi:hypothetical protein
MPRGPKGEKRPADVIGNAVHVMRIATGEIEETKQISKTERARRGGLKGGKARAVILSPKERQKIAHKGAKTRWSASAKKEMATSPARGKKEHQ